MAILETSAKWTFVEPASTGAVGLKAIDCHGYAQALSFYVESGPGCTATVNIQTRVGSSSGAWANLCTLVMDSTTAMKVVQFLGPLGWVRPYATAKTTGTLTVELLGN